VVWVAGVDGCRAGWFAVLRAVECGKTAHAGPLRRISEVLALPQKPRVVAVDIPIGLPDAAERGGRACDRIARKLLGKRGCCVFSPPVRAALSHSDNYEGAKRANRMSSIEKIGLSRQAFSISQKIREVDECIHPEQQDRVKEVHPEPSFFELNDRVALMHGKKKKRGFDQRRELLSTAGFETLIKCLLQHRPPGVGLDDALDACVACWTAERILSGLGVCVPHSPTRDRKQLRMEIWR
jgi:predicted RNase H-like nuclease